MDEPYDNQRLYTYKIRCNDLDTSGCDVYNVHTCTLYIPYKHINVGVYMCLIVLFNPISDFFKIIIWRWLIRDTFCVPYIITGFFDRSEFYYKEIW